MLRALLLLVFAFATLIPAAEAEGPCVPKIDGPKWKSMPIYYRLGTNVPRSIVEEAFQTWRSPSLRFEESEAAPSIIMASSLPGDYIGYTNYFTTTDDAEGITHFILRIDEAHLQASGLSWKAILVHEIGHAIGLGHASCNDSVMHDGGNLEELSPGDVAARDSIYPVHRVYLPAF